MSGVMRMRSMIFVFLISLLSLTCSPSSTSHTNYNNNNSSSISSLHFHPEECFALLAFINSFTINYDRKLSSHDTGTWKKGTNCCVWDVITCDPTSHHVIGLFLSERGLVGTLDSNSTLFHLHHLRYLDLSDNDFIPSTISPMFASSFPLLEILDISQVPLHLSTEMSTFHNIISNLTHLTDLYLGGVKIDSTVPPSLTNLSSLTRFSLSNCNLRGELRANVLTMPKLQSLYLNGNHDLHAHFPLSNCSTSLEDIDLSNVNFSSTIPTSSSLQYNQLQTLYLSGCSFHGQIPDWMWNNSGLETLDLSDNKFNGSINLNDIHNKFPNFNITTSLLYYLNISHNYLTGRLTSLPFKNLDVLDLSFNMFHGPLLIPPIGLTWFSASNNNFTGPLPSSFCNLTSLQILDLSNNILKDAIPHCLGNFSNNLIVLNLGSNNISGTFPDVTSSNCSGLKYLDLSFNLFEGSVPRFLTRCERLEVLNLKSNKLWVEFPHWLGTLSHIRVLDLSNNDFFGPLPPLDASNPFSKLQVLDLSNNNFSGKIPLGYAESFKEMMNITQNVGGPEYMESDDFLYSITLVFNGVEFKYDKIITTLATFDLSNNKFEGEIPNNIGKLVALHGLNLSHNQFIGRIPPSLGNLTLLNCLDLSSNKLTGKIPQELTRLSALGVFNVSENQLEGPIPNDNHFETFAVDSYKGNLALCGIPLTECGEHDRSRPQPSENENEDEDEGIMSEWKVVMMGFGVGAFVSFAWGWYMLSIGRPLCLLKLVLFLVDLLKRRLFGRHRRRPTRGRN